MNDQILTTAIPNVNHGFDGIDLGVAIGFTTLMIYVALTLWKAYTRTRDINRIVDKYGRLDKQFAAKNAFDDHDIYGDSLNHFKTPKANRR
jgi:hypothetical protein